MIMLDREKSIVNATALLKGGRPDDVIATMRPRERLILSSLGMARRVMLIEEIRDFHIGRLYESFAYNIELGLKIRILLREIAYALNSGLVKEHGSIEEIRKEPWLGFMEEQLYADTETKEKTLSFLFHYYHPELRKVPILIGGPTIQRILNGMKYVFNVVNFREVPDRRAGNAYSMSRSFYTEWSKKRGELLDRINTDPTGFVQWDTLVFYGLDNEMLKLRIREVDKLLVEFKQVYDGTVGNAEMTKLMEKAFHALHLPLGTEERNYVYTGTLMMLTEQMISIDDWVQIFQKEILEDKRKPPKEEMERVIKTRN